MLVLNLVASRIGIFYLCLFAVVFLPTLHSHPAFVGHVDFFPFADADHGTTDSDENAAVGESLASASDEISLPLLVSRNPRFLPSWSDGMSVLVSQVGPIEWPQLFARRAFFEKSDPPARRQVFIARPSSPRPPPRLA